MELPGLLDAVFINPPTRVAGTAVYLVSEAGLTPNAMMHNLKHNKVLHETNLFVHVEQHEVPWIGFDRRCEIEPLGHDCWQVALHFGFKNDPDVPEALALLRGRGVNLDEMETSYFPSPATSSLPDARGGAADRNGALSDRRPLSFRAPTSPTAMWPCWPTPHFLWRTASGSASSVATGRASRSLLESSPG